MRRMITETDVEKLDSIQPSEIEKLGKITDADIESVKAMQSPKNATANQVLTADGHGNATYKPAGGASYRGQNFIYNTHLNLKEDTAMPTLGGNIYVEMPTISGQKVLAIISPNFLKIDCGGKYIDPSRITIDNSGGRGIVIKVPKTVITEMGLTDKTSTSVDWSPLYAYVAA